MATLSTGLIKLEGRDNTYMKAVSTEIDVYRKQAPLVTDPSRYVGLELEFTCFKEESEIANMILERQDIAPYVTLQGDGSISGETCPTCDRVGCSECGHMGYSQGHELTILLKESEVSSVIPSICKFLASIGARVNKTCGFHVHIDMRNRDLVKADTNLVHIQEALYALNPVKRRDPSGYSRPTPAEATHKWREDVSRYFGINIAAYKKYGTLEVRIHAGTINAKDIIPWVKLLLTAVDYSKPIKEACTISELIENLPMPANLVRYVREKERQYRLAHWVSSQRLIA